MRASALRLSVSLSAIVLLLGFPVADVHAGNAKVCRSQEQRYEQIERQASSIEINLALFSAADKGCLDLAKHLLEEGASVESRDRFGVMPLARAAAAGELELVTLFLERGAPIDAQAIDGSTALYTAAENGRLPIVKLLVERGAKVSLPGRNGITPLTDSALEPRRALASIHADRAGLDATPNLKPVAPAGPPGVRWSAAPVELRSH